MPLYEYQCDACGHRFERIQKFSDPPIETCPTCGGSVQKLLSSPAIQFKGSGWYITDYARAGKGDTASAAAGRDGASSGSGSGDNKAEPKTEGKTEGKTDSKSDSTSESKSDSKPAGGAKPSSSTPT
jgi:putative FmdB family regulatory protein